MQASLEGIIAVFLREAAFHQRQEKREGVSQKKEQTAPGGENKIGEGWEVRESRAYPEQLREGQHCRTTDCEVRLQLGRLGWCRVNEEEDVGVFFCELNPVGKAHKHAVFGTGHPCFP